MNTISCPPREKLKDYLAGWSEPAFSDAIEAHLAECLSCEQTVVALEADPDTLVEYLRGAHESSSPVDPEINSALSDARHLIDSELDTGHEQNAEARFVTSEIGAYELLRPLGRGGMGTVFLARHRQLGKQVAIKLLPARALRGDHFAARFLREIRAAGELEHAAIVNATDAGEHEGTYYLVMEYIDGLDLSRIARLVGKLSIADACSILRTIALGLSHAHAVGIVHRDIKPSNMMLSNTGQVKILDFGLAQHNLWDETSAELTTVGQLMGTLDYMAPEQAERADAVDYRADLYSLGATLFRLVCGRAPLAATPNLSPLAKLRLLASHEAPSLDTLRPDAPPELVKLVKSLLARDPAERPASAAHVAEQLQPFSTDADLISLIGQAQTNSAKQPEENLQHVTTALPRIAPSALATPAADLGSGESKSRWGWLIAAALTPLFLFAGVLITLEFQKGQLVIESEVADVSVSLLKDGEVYQQLKIEPGVNTTRLYAGKYQVEIDSGSDAVQIDDNQFTIQKGKATIAHVRTVDTNKAVPPAMVALPKLGSMPETQSIESEILELEIKAGELLARLGPGHPSLAHVEGRLKLLREFADRSGPPASSSNPPISELIYEGKTLTQWLGVLAHERSPDALYSAFTAVEALILPESHQQISEILLKVLPTLNGKMRFKSGGDDRTRYLDTEAFGLLVRATPAAEYYPLLARECERSEDLKWSSRILKSWKVATADSAPTALVDWLQANVFESKERHPLLDEAKEIFAEVLLYKRVPIDLALEDRMLKTLEDCKFLGHDFWLGSFIGGALNNDHTLTAPGTKFAGRVCMHAIAALDDQETPPQYAVQAILLLGSVRGSLAELVGDYGSATLNTALRKRLATLSTSSELLFELAELKPPFVRSRNHDLIHIQHGYMLTARANSSNDRVASLAIEFLRFVKDLDIGLTLSSELTSIYQSTVPLSRDLYLSLVDASPYHKRNAGTRFDLRWPELIVPESWSARFSAEPTQKHWLAIIIRTEALSALPAKISVQLQSDESHATNSAWTQARFAQFDSDKDDKLSLDEFAMFATELKLQLSFALADKNEDKAIGVEELFEYLESGSPMQSRLSPETSSSFGSSALDWAKRQIGKYDLNSDGVLTASEWERMFIKPTGADANNDGIITAEEYATFRAK